MGSRFLWILVASAVSLWTGFLLLPLQTHGETARGGEELVAQPGPTESGSRRNAKASKRLLHMEEVEIYGEVEKPKTMFVIPRARLPYSRQQQGKDFTDDILGPVTNRWVEDRQRWRRAQPDR